MATRSTISLETEKGIKTIYCHWDGYPDHHLPILKEHYNTVEKVEALINIGNLSSLDKSIECPEGHNFETPIKGYCVAYGRDREEKDQEADINTCIQEIDMQEYNYIFRNNEWEII
jgi:hypothetical protein